MARKQPANITSNVTVRIPVPDRLLRLTDENERSKALEAHWKSYGYSDRFTLEDVIDGHFIMVRR